MQHWQIVAISVAVVVIIAAAAVLIYYKTRGRRLRARLKPLSTSDRLRFGSEWMECQAAFVEDPAGAVDSADRLITDVLRARGRSVTSSYDRLEDIRMAYPKHADDVPPMKSGRNSSLIEVMPLLEADPSHGKFAEDQNTAG